MFLPYRNENKIYINTMLMRIVNIRMVLLLKEDNNDDDDGYGGV